jgi:hypothetical protein
VLEYYSGEGGCRYQHPIRGLRVFELADVEGSYDASCFCGWVALVMLKIGVEINVGLTIGGFWRGSQGRGLVRQRG